MTRPISVTLIAGFLGAGKTTFINRLLRSADLSDTVVVVNEFGEIGLDHLLVEGADDTVLELSNGCICCSIRGALVDTLVDLLARKPKRIVIETTGIADPLPILQSVMGHPLLANALSSPSVLTVVDGRRGFEDHGEHGEFSQQIALANQVLVSKCDRLEADVVLEAKRVLGQRLYELNPGAPVVFLDDVSDDGLLHALLTGAQPERPVRLVPRQDLHGSAGSSPYRTTALYHAQPVPFGLISRFIATVVEQHANGLLRLKGLVLTTETPDRPLVLNGVGAVFEPPTLLDGWGGLDPSNQLVVITKNTDPGAIERLFYSMVGLPQVDTPDRAALEDNPLAIPGT